MSPLQLFMAGVVIGLTAGACLGVFLAAIFIPWVVGEEEESKR